MSGSRLSDTRIDMRRRPVCTILLALLALGSYCQPAWAVDVPVLDTNVGREQPLFVIGVPDPLLSSVRQAILELFGSEALSAAMPIESTGSLDSVALMRASTVIALGRDGCAAVIAAVIGARSSTPVLCTLLYSDAFSALDCADVCERIEAIVMDQPPGRQARVAATLFPALERFGLLRSTLPAFTPAQIELRLFEPQRRLNRQLADLLVSVDAVVVEPRSGVYPPESLRTVLLTAYGWDKPIVGYGPDWVRAGALVSAYSTPRDLLSDVRDILRLLRDTDELAEPRERMSSRFHVVENPAIARSLGLRRASLVVEGRDFDDSDFPP